MEHEEVNLRRKLILLNVVYYAVMLGMDLAVLGVGLHDFSHASGKSMAIVGAFLLAWDLYRCAKRQLPVQAKAEDKLTPQGWLSLSLEQPLEHSDVVMGKVHSALKCRGEFCTIHHRSLHPMRHFPQHWRRDWGGFMERICPHEIGHPDPDEVDLLERGLLEHGCDGCCARAYDRLFEVKA